MGMEAPPLSPLLLVSQEDEAGEGTNTPLPCPQALHKLQSPRIVPQDLQSDGVRGRDREAAFKGDVLPCHPLSGC